MQRQRGRRGERGTADKVPCGGFSLGKTVVTFPFIVHLRRAQRRRRRRWRISWSAFNELRLWLDEFIEMLPFVHCCCSCCMLVRALYRASWAHLSGICTNFMLENQTAAEVARWQGEGWKGICGETTLKCNPHAMPISDDYLQILCGYAS